MKAETLEQAIRLKDKIEKTKYNIKGILECKNEKFKCEWCINTPIGMFTIPKENPLFERILEMVNEELNNNLRSYEKEFAEL